MRQSGKSKLSTTHNGAGSPADHKMNQQEFRNKYAENAVLVVVARASMALFLPILGALWYFFADGIDSRFAAIDHSVAVVQQTLNEKRLEDREIRDRVLSLETKRESEKAETNRFRGEVSSTLDSFRRTLSDVSNDINSLSVRLQTSGVIRQRSYRPDKNWRDRYGGVSESDAGSEGDD